jgi:hypothetical protein
MTPIGQPCTCEPMTWLYFVFGQSVFVFVGQTLAMAKLRSAGAPGGELAAAKSDGDIWSWAFGAKEDTAAAKQRRAAVDAAGAAGGSASGGLDGGDGSASGGGGGGGGGAAAAAAPVSALLTDLERWAVDGGNSWSQALMEQSRRVATDAIARARSAEANSTQSSSALEAARERTAALQAAQAKRATVGRVACRFEGCPLASPVS